MSTVTLYPTHDTFVTQPAPNYNFAADKKLVIGNDWYYGLARTWLKFSLASIPVGSAITSATLTLRSFYTNNGGTYPPTMFYDLYRCTNNSWTESTITWNNAPNASCGSVIGQYDYYINYRDVITYTDIQSEISAALPDSNITFRLKLDDEGNPGYGEWFADRDFPSSYPVLVIDYEAPFPPPGIITHPAGSEGDADDSGQYFEPTRRPDYKPVPEKVKESYLKTLKDISKEPEPSKPKLEPRKKRKTFKEPTVEYRRPKIRATGTVAPSIRRPEPALPDPLRAQRIQAFADRRREAREAAAAQMLAAEQTKQDFIKAQTELRAQIETERALMAQHLEKLIVEQDDEEAATAVLLLVK